MGQQEQLEWENVNKLLQHHGFKPVHFADPVENKNISDLVLLDKRSAGEMRATLRTMLMDSERRQALNQELVKSNNQLKEEVREHASRADRLSQRATKLEGLLDGVKARVQDIEDRYLGIAAQHHSKTQQLLQEKQDAQKLCEVVEQKLSRQREKTAELQRKLYFAIKEEERGLAPKSNHSSAVDRQRLREDNPMKISEHVSDQARQSSQYHQLLTEISASVTDPSAPLRPHTWKPSSADLELAEFHNLLPTLEVWARQLHLLKELRRGLTKLTARLVPWQLSDVAHDSSEAAKVEDMMLLVDTMLESTSTDDKILRSPTRYTLGSMVSHFQKLFDVTSLNGIYPRMNEVYTRLEEMSNTMRNLKDILDLDSRASHAEVVNQVARLVRSNGPTDGLRSLLGDADIDSILVKVKQHEEFFPAFHDLIMDILQLLGVNRLDDILPALKSLKQTAR